MTTTDLIMVRAGCCAHAAGQTQCRSPMAPPLYLTSIGRRVAVTCVVCSATTLMTADQRS